MSEQAMSALPGAAAEGLVSIREAGRQGMVSLRADLSAAPVVEALRKAVGAEMPGPRAIASGKDGVKLAWMAPDEGLILCPHTAASGVVAELSEALAGTHHLALNLSDARAMFELTGEAGLLRDVLSKLTPADLSADVLKPGEMRRTRLQQVPAALWFEEETTARVICFRSVAQYVFDLLRMAAQAGGDVSYH